MEIQLLNNGLLSALHDKAQVNERLRQNYDLRTTPEDGSQRMLNVLQPGTKVAVHRHLKTSETAICVEGCIDWIFYEELPNVDAGGPIHDGETAADESQFKEVARFRICPREGQFGIQIPKGAWHSIEVHEPSAILRLRMGRTENNNQQAFFELLRAGLWEKEARLSAFEGMDYAAILRLAEEQSVVGLVAAGLEHVQDVKVPREVALTFAGATLQIEQRNKAMNAFVAGLIEQLRATDVYALLVKGQGIAQCYERPLWRSAGDVDLLLDAAGYEKAKKLLLPLATRVESEFTFMKHVGMTLDGWVVELHGTLHSRLSRRIDNEIDKVQESVWSNGEFRVWHNGDTVVYLPAPDADVFFVFTHFLHHFFLEGLGLRQICDWCRLLWTFAREIDVRLLERRLLDARLMSEWRAFAALAVDWLGMPAEAMPLYCGDSRWSRKGDKILADVLRKGNFGRNERGASDLQRAYLVRKLVSAWRHLGELLRHFWIFPWDSVGFFGRVLCTGMDAAFRGE